MSLSTQFMTIVENFIYAILPDLDATAQSPYSNSRFSLVIVLPNKCIGLNAVEKQLQTLQWTQITDQMNSHKVNVTILKFKAEFKINLKAALTNVCSQLKRLSVSYRLNSLLMSMKYISCFDKVGLG